MLLTIAMVYAAGWVATLAHSPSAEGPTRDGLIDATIWPATAALWAVLCLVVAYMWFDEHMRRAGV